MQRSIWHKRTSLIIFFWLISAALAPLYVKHSGEGESPLGWMQIHLIFLGAATNAIFIWAWHFTLTVLMLPDRSHKFTEAWRLLLLNIGIFSVVMGGWHESAIELIAGSVIVCAAILWLLNSIQSSLKLSLPSRFKFVVIGYRSATLLLLIGVILGGIIGSIKSNSGASEIREQLVLAHLTINILGWIFITIWTTLVTLGPTLLKTRLTEGAEKKAIRANKLFVTGVLIAAISFSLNLNAIAPIGLAIYLYGAWLILSPIIENLKSNTPANFATWSTLIGVIWAFLAMISGIAMSLIHSPVLSYFIGNNSVATGSSAPLTETDGLASWLYGDAVGLARYSAESLLDSSKFIIVMIIGALLQILLGTMSYLLPSMVGGGPQIVKIRVATANKFASLRLAGANLGLFGLLFGYLKYSHSLRVVIVLLLLLTGLATIALLLRSARKIEITS